MSKLLALESIARQRLFAVIHMFGKQHIVTEGDLLMVDNDIPVNCGQNLLINKCLVLGGKEFSIIGTPVLDKDVFKIEATVVEKTMSDHKLLFKHKPRDRGLKKYMFQSLPRTVLRINKIDLKKLPEC